MTEIEREKMRCSVVWQREVVGDRKLIISFYLPLCFLCSLSLFWKCNFPMKPYQSRSVCHNFLKAREVTLTMLLWTHLFLSISHPSERWKKKRKRYLSFSLSISIYVYLSLYVFLFYIFFLGM